MPTLLQAIRAILHPEVIPGGLLRLKEKSHGNAAKPILLQKQRGQDVVLLKPDQCAGGLDRLFPLFRPDVAGLRAMCDYIVFCQENAGDDKPLFVLLCELKSQNTTGAARQIENGRLLADYILETANLHHQMTKRPTIERRGLVFTTGRKVPMGNLYRERCVYTEMVEGFTKMLGAYYPYGASYPIEHFCS